MKIAVIPARGGSKRIPRKNVREFAGRPIIEWSIEAALSSELFDVVLVSTDDEEISAVAVAAGAAVPFIRPARLSDDYATTTQVMAHALEWAESDGRQVGTLCCLYATAPFITTSDLVRAESILVSDDLDYVFAAARFPYPAQRALVQVLGGGVDMLNPEHRLTRSQDLPVTYHDAGQFYWGRSDAWRQDRPIFSPRSRFLELSRWQTQDIDTPDDWTMAEYLFEIVNRDGR